VMWGCGVVVVGWDERTDDDDDDDDSAANLCYLINAQYFILLEKCACKLGLPLTDCVYNYISVLASGGFAPRLHRESGALTLPKKHG